MEEEKIKFIAAQLRKPAGEYGIEIGERLIESNRTIYQHTLGELSAKASDRILEIGMGIGIHVKEILNIDDSISYVGVDYSKLMVDESVCVNGTFVDEKRARFIHADVHSLPLTSEYFTKVFTVNTIYFWDDVDLGIKELHRVLKSDGWLHIAGRPKHVMENYPFAQYGFRMFDKEELGNLLKAHGFTSINIVEKKEDDREIDGEMFPIETLIVSGKKL